MIIETHRHHAVRMRNHSPRRARPLAIALVVFPGPVAVLLPLITLGIVGDRAAVGEPSTSWLDTGWVIFCGAACLFAAWWCLSSSVIARTLLTSAEPNARSLWWTPRILVRCVAAVLGVNIACAPATAVASPPTSASTSTAPAPSARDGESSRPTPLFASPRGTQDAGPRLTPYFRSLGRAATPPTPLAPQIKRDRAPRSDTDAQPSTGTRTWIVSRHESLWSISVKLLGSDAPPSAVQRTVDRIESLNRSVLSNHPDLIYAGTRLAVPEEPNR